VVRDLLTALSPVCPFFTHHITDTVYGASAVDADAFPTTPVPDLGPGEARGNALRSLSNDLQEFNSQTWAMKKEMGRSLNQPIEDRPVPDALDEFTATLTRMHQLQ